jgi:peptidoglycan/xylan/chitin deacetylase (PgdA/CDA1 family)
LENEDETDIVGPSDFQTWVAKRGVLVMAKELPILAFHSLDDQSSVISFSPELFRRGMAKLHKMGYRTLSLLETVDCLCARKPFPDQSFVITFDDGYQSVYEQAFPALQQYDMSATVFLTVGEKEVTNPAYRLPSLNGRSMLSWTEIQEMKRWGIELGAHTLTHPDLTRLPRERMEAEICDSKKLIENTLSTPVSCFAYPYGRYNDHIQEVVQRHFSCACSDRLGLMNLGSDPNALERVDAYYLRTDKLFDLIWTRAFPSYVRVRGMFRRIRCVFQLS